MMEFGGSPRKVYLLNLTKEFFAMGHIVLRDYALLTFEQVISVDQSSSNVFF